MTIPSVKNQNYCGVVTRVSALRALENCNNIVAGTACHAQVLVSKDTPEGALGIFFPAGCALAEAFLAVNNLYGGSAASLNSDPTKRGYFEKHGRVRAVRFRGHLSDGIWLPVKALCAFYPEAEALAEGTEIDAVEGPTGLQTICWRYTPRVNPPRAEHNRQGRTARPEDALLPGQFHFHIDTPQLRRCLGDINPSDQIVITEKLHGTSAIFGKLRAKRTLPWYERALRALGVRIETEEYSSVWASRRVLKGVAGEGAESARHYYGEDIWGVVSKELEGIIPEGYTLYGEIVGWTPGGRPIQPNYEYGCAVGTHKFYVYRITQTSPSGEVLELTWEQIKNFCGRRSLSYVPQVYVGPVIAYGDPWPEATTNTDGEIVDIFFEKLSNFVNDAKRLEPNGFPKEGVVVRKAHAGGFAAYKVKSRAFLEHETAAADEAAPDMEEEN